MKPLSPVRFRQFAVASAAVAALVAGAAVGAGDEPPAEEPVTVARSPVPGAEPRDLAAARQLPLMEQAGAIVVLRFVGTRAPEYVERALRRGRAAGVILFRDNVTTPRRLRRMTRRLHAAGGRRGDPLISVDQEGGSVRRIPFSGPLQSQSAIGTAEEAGAVARAAARRLGGLGINVNLAPVADVPSVRGSVMRDRAFPGGTAAVSRILRSSVVGYRGTGVLPALKHFPGIGGATVNTDDGAVTIRRRADDIAAVDLPPFRAGVAAGAPLVMTSHALYPALDPHRIASQSRAVHDLLREEMGFKGLIVTDSLEAAAVRSRGGHRRGAVRSVRAGADLLLTTGRGSYLDVLRAVAAEARRSPAFRERVVESAARVLAVRRRLAQG